MSCTSAKLPKGSPVNKGTFKIKNSQVAHLCRDQKECILLSTKLACKYSTSEAHRASKCRLKIIFTNPSFAISEDVPRMNF